MTGNDPVIPPDGQHRYALRVYYEDTDAGGIVYHAGYLRFAERARTEALRDMGIPHAEMVERFGVMFVVRTLTIDYLRAARLDDSLTVITSAQEVGGASVLLRQDVLGPDGACAELRVRLACVAFASVGPASVGPVNVMLASVGPGGNKPGRIPPRWRSVLSAMRDRARAD